MELPNLRSTLLCLALALVLCTTHTIPPAEGRDLHAECVDGEGRSALCSGLGRRPRPAHASSTCMRNVSTLKDDLPSEVDWRKRGVLLPPLNQQSCECCWALATAASIEALYRIKTGRSLRLSAQELVDCDKTNNGCNKGSPRAAFSWIVKNGGIATNSDYPFVARQDQCSEQKLGIHAVTITGYVAVGKTEADLMTAVAVAGLSLAKDDAYKKYRGGVFEGPCGDYKHAVTVVGYGTSDKGVPYWIVKNSYGTSWGEKGYMYIRRGVQQPGGLCGIAEKASYPLM